MTLYALNDPILESTQTKISRAIDRGIKEQEKIFIRARLKDGSGCFVDVPEEVGNMMANGENRDEYEFSIVWMTQSRFDKLEEFQGF